VASLQRSHSVLKIADRRDARCAVASNAVCALCKRIERQEHAQIKRRGLAFARRVRQRAVATLWGLLERRGRVVDAPREHCKDAV